MDVPQAGRTGKGQMSNIEQMRLMSPQELALFGLHDVAYIKRVIGKDQAGYAVHAADGTPIALLHDRALAFATVRLHDIEPVSVH
jgi:hypothetical protein